MGIICRGAQGEFLAFQQRGTLELENLKQIGFLRDMCNNFHIFFLNFENMSERDKTYIVKLGLLGGLRWS